MLSSCASAEFTDAKTAVRNEYIGPGRLQTFGNSVDEFERTPNTVVDGKRRLKTLDFETFMGRNPISFIGHLFVHKSYYSLRAELSTKRRGEPEENITILSSPNLRIWKLRNFFDSPAVVVPPKALLLGYSVGSFNVYRTKNYRIRTCVCVCVRMCGLK